MFQSQLIHRLPPVRGRLTADAPLAPHTWFRVGGPAEVLFRPADADDLIAFLKNCPADIPITAIGVASNLLVRDGGVPGVVIKLGRGFAEIEITDQTVKAGAGSLDLTVSQVACEAGLAGLEFLCGIPGTIGGAVRMNAGAYGREIVDILIDAIAVDRQGDLRKISKSDLVYRGSNFSEDWIVLEATLQGQPEDQKIISQRMADIQRMREESQPVRSRTGGSTFANPPGHKAWQLIDQAGCRGLRVGDAQISEKHCNFLLNLGQATAADIETLGEEVRQRVKDKFNIDLRWEIKRIGIQV